VDSSDRRAQRGALLAINWAAAAPARQTLAQHSHSLIALFLCDAPGARRG
jgi:hypothetical protein